jgi:MFS family permease
MLAASSLTYAALLIAVAGTRSFVAAQALLLCTGFAMIVNGALLNGLLQALVPDELRGRLMAAYSFVAVGCAQTIGALLAGVVAESFGVDWAIGAGAVVMLGFSLWVFRRFPELRAMG